jgi:hypothetical protein
MVPRDGRYLPYIISTIEREVYATDPLLHLRTSYLAACVEGDVGIVSAQTFFPNACDTALLLLTSKRVRREVGGDWWGSSNMFLTASCRIPSPIYCCCCFYIIICNRR